MKVSAKIRKRFNLLFKILLVSIVYSFLFFELGQHWTQLNHENFFNLNNHEWGLVLIALMLMPLNWFVESLKWRYLIQKIEKLTALESIKAVFAGTAISIFTPNRVGDYLGRVFILKKGDRLDGIVATIVGNLSQLLVTVLLGLVSFFYFMDHITELYFHWSPLFTVVFRLVIVLIALGLLMLFLNFPALEKRFNSRLELHKYPILKHLNFLSEFSRSQIVNTLLLSLLRYLIYSLQFFILFRAFQVELPLFEGFLMIFLIFFGITVVPSIAVAELGIRAIITLLVFEIIGQQMPAHAEISLINATSVLWLMNIALAAIIGGIFIFNLRFFRKSDLVEPEEKATEE